MRHFCIALIVALATSLTAPANAQSPADQKAAETSAEAIVKAFGQQKYKLVWDQLTSKWFKERVTEDAFLANLSLGRAQIGIMRSTSLISSEYSNRDPGSGFQGDIYAVMFRSKYTTGDIFERIVVIKEPDGRFRLSGFFANPVPAQ